MKTKSRLELIQEIEKELAEKQAELDYIKSQKENVKKGDIIIILRDLEWVAKRGAKMEVHSVSTGHIHAGYIGKPSQGTYWITDGDYTLFVEKDEYITGQQPLEYRNNWESDVYTIKGKPVTNLKKVKINGAIYDVTSRNVSVSYSDHGHTYTANSKHYFVKESVFGESREFDLNTLMKKGVIAVEYDIHYEVK